MAFALFFLDRGNKAPYNVVDRNDYGNHIQLGGTP
jgi:hypothetical protein